MCQKYGFPTAARSYEHFVDKEMSVLENEKVKLLWDFSIQTEIKIDHINPDIVLLDKKEKTCYVVDVACPFDTRVEKKEKEKFEHYTDLKYELLKVCNTEVTKVYIIPIVIGALGIVTKNVAKYPSSGRCFVAQQRRPGRQPVTAEKSRRKWSKEINVIIMECYIQSKPADENGVPIRGYRQRMYKAWQERGMFTAKTRLIYWVFHMQYNGWCTEYHGAFHQP